MQPHEGSPVFPVRPRRGTTGLPSRCPCRPLPRPAALPAERVAAYAEAGADELVPSPDVAGRARRIAPAAEARLLR